MMKFTDLFKRLSISLLAAITIFSFFLSNFQIVQASSFSKDNIDITFSFPDSETVIPVTDEDNRIHFTDLNSSSVEIYVSDLYYEVTENGKASLVKKYPKDDIWIGCGLFDDTWDNQDYIYQYLSSIVNQGTAQYSATIEKIAIQGLPIYKFSYYEEIGNPEKPGGVIYLTLYHAKLYTVYFSNFYTYSAAANYSTAFENTLQINGITEYDFPVFHGKIVWILISAGAVLVFAAIGGFCIYKRKKRIVRGN